MNISSKDLQVTQTTLETMLKNEIDNPMTNYAKVNRLTKLIKEVDTLRRETWNNEKFGQYDNIADMYISNDFNSDDIPF